ncbi:MBL fold metallo-hydrolase [Rasiella rasia]|uniref:MBL fold metallo-hydrolase n=1 Tax=Rasiella rasia TaxID=2744027 RepID=A0A6G6GJX9_9FLAO|nr:MBL fold metallo-hydrolase [Rasiella rasia]QIE58824.1 MBL fold metallo-hydrolase [Rasiella rasia]
MKKSLYLLLLCVAFVSCKEQTTKNTETETATETSSEIVENSGHSFNVTPISHATMVLEWDGIILYVDPVGGAEAFQGQPEADIVLVTDIHGDHFNMETLNAVAINSISIVAPKAVADKMDASITEQVIVLNNGETTTVPDLEGFTIEAVPMYNLREEALKYHEKGRGNGYVIEKDGKRVYISGDTEDIPEMRNLKNIDIAFVCMNLPYTMTVQKAASAVVDFKPTKVYPYHYRGTEGLSDVGVFKAWIMKSSVGREIEVVQLDWYPNQ